MNRDEARRLIERTLALSKADECSVSLTASRDANIRYARNQVTTSGDVEDLTLNVRAAFGRRSGGSTLNQFDDASLERCVRQAEEISRFAPEDPEYVEMLGAQSYADADAWDEPTAELPPERRAELARGAIDLAKARNVVIAGFFTNSGQASAIGNSKGLFGWGRTTRVTYSATARTGDGKGSGWAGINGERFRDVDAAGMAGSAVDKAFRSAAARELAPGTYPVILEPSAVADLILFMGFAMDARSADEGRSFFSVKGGGTRSARRCCRSG